MQKISSSWLHLRLIVLVLLIIYGPVIYAQTWISIDGTTRRNSVTVDILESTQNCYKAKVTIHGLYDMPINHGDTLYHQIVFPEFATEGNVGTPQLPIVSQLLILPSESYTVSVEEIKWSTIPLGHIYPVQPDFFEEENTSVFYRNSDIYSSHSYEPMIIQLGQKSSFCGTDNFSVKVCPFKYYPSQGILSVLSEFIIKVNFTGTSKIKTTKGLSRTTMARQNSLFDNSNIILQILPKNDNVIMSNIDEDYLIIVGNVPNVMGCNAMDDFLRWKAFKGYKIKVVTTAETGITSNAIKTYISNERLSHPNLSYVLFIGEHEYIPMNYMDSPVQGRTVYSDYWYGCMDNSNPFYADIAIGRFSVSNVTEFANMVNKTIKYEIAPPSYSADALLVANKEYAPGKYQGCLESIRTTNYTESPSFFKAYGASVNCQGDSATNQDVIEYINGGINIVNYRGHGINKEWSSWNAANESFTDAQINNMDSSVCSVFLCISCWNGNIADSSCMLETFTRPNYGAAALLGATHLSRTIANHSYNKLLFDYIYNQGCYHVGDVNILAHYNNIQGISSSYTDDAKYNSLIYLWGGDPTLELWTDTPKKIQDVELHEDGNVQIYIQGLTNYKVSVVTEDNVLVNVLNSTNEICTIPTPATNVYFVINKHNYIPYIIKYDITSNYIQNTTLAYDAHYYKGTPVAVGYNVDSSQAYGNVILKKNSSLNLNKGQGVIIKNGFMQEKGSTLKIK